MQLTECMDKDRRESSEAGTVPHSKSGGHQQRGVCLVFRLVKEAICDNSCWVIGQTFIIESHV